MFCARSNTIWNINIRVNENVNSAIDWQTVKIILNIANKTSVFSSLGQNIQSYATRIILHISYFMNNCSITNNTYSGLSSYFRWRPTFRMMPSNCNISFYIILLSMNMWHLFWRKASQTYVTWELVSESHCEIKETVFSWDIYKLMHFVLVHKGSNKTSLH